MSASQSVLSEQVRHVREEISRADAYTCAGRPVTPLVLIERACSMATLATCQLELDAVSTALFEELTERNWLDGSRDTLVPQPIE